MNRVAAALVRGAAARWPAGMRADLLREWTAELHAIARDPDASAGGRTVRALRFGLSLAVRRPVRDPAPLRVEDHPALRLFGVTLAVTVLGPFAAMVLVALASAALDAAGAQGAVRDLPILLMAPFVVVVAAVLGTRSGRGRPAPPLPAAAAIGAGLVVAGLFGVYGEGPVPLVALAVWAAGIAPVAAAARVVRRPVAWAGLGAAVLLLTDVAVTAAVWASTGAAAAPRAYLPNWFPAVLLDPMLHVPLGPTGDALRFTLADSVELLPYGLLALTVLVVAHVRARPAAPARAPVPAP